MGLRQPVMAILIISILGCGGGEQKSSAFIPDIPLECTTAQVAGCSGNSLPVFVGIIESLGGVDCDDFLTGMNSLSRRTTFLASTSVTSSRRGIYLYAYADSWQNTSGGTVDVLAPGEYFVCAFVDSNSNGLLDTNEPVGHGTIKAGQTGFILSDWFAAYN